MQEGGTTCQRNNKRKKSRLEREVVRAAARKAPGALDSRPAAAIKEGLIANPAENKHAEVTIEAGTSGAADVAAAARTWVVACRPPQAEWWNVWFHV